MPVSMGGVRKREINAAIDAANIDRTHVLKFFQVLQVNCTPDEIAEVLVIYLDQTDPLRK